MIYDTSMGLRIILLSAGSKIRMLHNFVTELSSLRDDFQIHVLDSNPKASIEDPRVYYHWINPCIWKSSISMYKCLISFNGDIILPTRNAELFLLSRVKEEYIELGEKIVVSPRDVVANCIDKYKLANSNRIDKRFFIDTYESVDEITSKTAVIKDRFGAGSKGLVICDTKKINGNTISKFKQPIFQNFVKGKEFSADLYFTKSSSLHALSLRFRDRTIDGESVQSTFFSNKNINFSLTSLFRDLKFRGPINVQGFLLENGMFKLFDINPRLGGSYFMSKFNGFNLSKWLVQEYFESSSPDRFYSKNFSGVVIRNGIRYEVK